MEWKNLQDEFPTDKNTKYLVRISRKEFSLIYFCIVIDREESFELTGYSALGRRYSAWKRKNPKPVEEEPETFELFTAPEDEKPLIEWARLEIE